MKKMVLITLFLASSCLFAQTKLFDCVNVGVMDAGYYINAQTSVTGGYIFDIYEITFSGDNFLGRESVKIEKKATDYKVTQINDKDNNHMLFTLHQDGSADFYIEFGGKAIPEFFRKMHCTVYVNLSNYIK